MAIKTHGQTGTPLYAVWNAMIGRCYRPAVPQYKDWGGRGITVCEKWHSFAGFFEDMGERPEGMTLERLDNDKGYSKENCKWATPLEQGRNRRNNCALTIDGVTKHLAEWARESGIPRSTLANRVYLRKWPIDSRLLRPVQPGVRFGN